MRSLSLSTSGKITLITLCGIATGLLFSVFFFYNFRVPTVSADNVTTSVYVLNTPPVWTVDAQENNAGVVDSSTSTPTNAGDVIAWTATGTDSNNDNYYLLICKTSGTPTANSGAAPTCNGGIGNQWAVSAVTASAAVARAATTTKEGFPFNNEKNDWYAWICDNNASLAQCNTLVKNGAGTTGPSPFFVDHPPVFTLISNNSPQNPGASLTWSATATTTDIIRGGDSVKLYVCKANDFTSSSSTAACGAGGTWATSTVTKINPTATYTLPIPTQDTNYNAYVFITNNFNLAATSSVQATNSTYTVNNVAPTITQSSITVVDPVHSSSTLVLTQPNGTTSPYWVQFQVNDNNSCLNSSSGNEIASVAVNVFRSGIGSTSCLTSGNYNANNCYPSAATGNTDFVCTQDAGSCTGATDSNVTFTCKFSLWYNADATDVGSQFPGQKWSATVKATDDQGLTTQGPSSGFVEATIGSTTLASFLAFAVPQTSIAYGGLQPGQQIDPFTVATSTSLRELGNTGIDESLYGDTMCTTWSSPDSCDQGGFDNTKDIGITNQKAATSTIAYSSSQAYTLAGSTTPVSVPIHIPKTTSTSSPQSGTTLWAIKIPNTITLAGTYTGQNTITAVTSPSSSW